MQRLLFLAVLAESHNAVKLLVVLAANLTAELVHLILKVNTVRLTAGGSSKKKKPKTNKTAEQIRTSLTLGKGYDFQTKPDNKNIKIMQVLIHFLSKVVQLQKCLGGLYLCPDILFFNFQIKLSYLLKKKRWSHLPFQSFRFQTEGSSAVVAFQLNRVVSSGQRWLSVCGRLKSSVLGKINKNMSHSPPTHAARLFCFHKL